ncbi:MAG: hypothetical protein KDK91_34375, partial [Gammaproteobacteria bacterium]|nr:hypothetical protein [Gammaproteobacteria bacterium]
YSPLATGASAFVFYNPISALTVGGTTLGVRVGVNQFLKNVLFNKKIGREALDMIKEPAKRNPQTRRQFAKIMTALNGTEAAVLYTDPQGKEQGSKRVVIRTGPGGVPQFVPLD